MWKRFGNVHAWALLGLGVGGLGLQVTAHAQPPGAPPVSAKKKHFLPVRTGAESSKAAVWTLPVEIDERTRSALREVCLFVKKGNGNWDLQETASPAVKTFTYRAGQDGEYWFHLVTIDKNGKANPADLNREPAALQVIVDTQEPVLDLEPWIAPDGQVHLKCAVQDAHPDINSLKLAYRGSDGIDHLIDPLANFPGVFRLPLEAYHRPVLVTAKDLCGNTAFREYQMPMPVQTSAATPPAPGPAPAAVPPVIHRHDVSAVPPPPPVTPAVYQTPKPSPESNGGVPKVVDGPAMDLTVPPAPPGSTPAAGNRLLLNTTKAALDYRFDQVGPSGISKVDVYITSDQGQTWQRLCEDADRRSPAEITLPGEGRFGLRLVVTNGNGFGGKAPARGEAPTTVIEVDTTPPHLQLRDIDPVTKDGCLEIRWTASDKNLGAEPVALYFRARPDQAWTAIGKAFKNDGLVRWEFPRDMGGQFFVKMEVTDQAGNVAKAESPNPVNIDMTEPRATVVGITALQARPVTPANP